MNELPARTMLPAVADDKFDRVAALTRRVLGVPTALVSLVDRSGQVFPGAVGLAAPWQGDRRTPLTHSFCQHVVTDGAPIVTSDARLDPRLRDSLAIEELGVIAYAGMPLTDDTGAVIGSLCAIDDEPRDWTASDLEMLSDLAASCSSELHLRNTVARAAVLADRERIAHDLHTGVVAELLALEMFLRSVRSVSAMDELITMLDEVLGRVARIMRGIGTSVFDDVVTIDATTEN